MKRWLGILLMIALVCLPAMAAVTPRPVVGHQRACKCCGCGGMDCCAAPVAPAPSSPPAAAAAPTVQKSFPTAPAVATVWNLPAATSRPVSLLSSELVPCLQSLHERLCVLLI